MAVAVIDRSMGSVPAGCGRGPRIASSIPLLALCVLLPQAAAQAGSIFMKNGYIIQGPIVEYSEGSEGSVVLGWPNGKVTIYRRFVEKVDFEAGEEKNTKVSESLAPAIPEEVLVAPGMEDDLPQSLPDLVKALNLNPKLIEGQGADGSAPADVSTPPGDLQTGVDVVPPPPEGGSTGEPATPGTGVKPPEGDILARRVSESRWGFSLEPPKGFRLNEVEGCVSWTGPAGSDGFSPSLNVVSVQKGTLKWEEACLALREDQKIPFRSYRILKEEPLELSNRPAFRVMGRGESAGAAPAAGKRVTVRQVMVEKGDRFWLISTFVGESGPENLAEALDRSVQTFQLEG